MQPAHRWDNVDLRTVDEHVLALKLECGDLRRRATEGHELDLCAGCELRKGRGYDVIAIRCAHCVET